MNKKLKTRLIIILICILIVVSVLVYLLTNTDFFKKDINSEETISNKLTCEILDESLELGTQFLINNQRPEGNFNYEYDFIKKLFSPGDNEVRQAGALWGITLIYNSTKDDRLQVVFEKGFDFFKNCSVESEDERKWVVYPGNQFYGSTGTIALLSLSIIDFLRSSENISAEFKEELELFLEKSLRQLIFLRMENGQFYRYYYLNNGTGCDDPSPYYDGEALLALTKAAKYRNKVELIPIILDSANKTYHAYVIEALNNNLDLDDTKGFFQWGCMSYFEIATTNWDNTNLFSDIVIDLADWMIDVHKTLERTRNTAYAFEGIIHAYELAKRNNDVDHSKKFASVVDEGLYKLTTWQVGVSIENIYLKNHTTTDQLAVGGIMNHKEEPLLRVDVAQHQMHALILAKKYIYNC